MPRQRQLLGTRWSFVPRCSSCCICSPTRCTCLQQSDDMLPDADLAQLMARASAVLGEHLAGVRESQWLVDSPCRLASADSGPERDLRRERRMLGHETEIPRKILEMNRRHPFVKNLARLVDASPDDPIATSVI
jgi:HSP90 family molecular chaperone